MSINSAAHPAFGSVAIVGIGGIFPDAPELDRFWHNIVSGHSAAREVPPDRWAVPADNVFAPEVAARDKEVLTEVDSPLAIGHRVVERWATRDRISLRTGTFCNPGAGEAALGLSKDDLDRCFKQSSGRLLLDEFKRCIDGETTGAVRVSLGLVSNFADVFAFREFLASFLQEPVGVSDRPRAAAAP